jgi:hypothetical protein
VLSHLGKGDALRKMKKYEEAIWTYNKANEIWTYNKANKIKKDGYAYAGMVSL